ncbi:MAG: hypothetical protein FRX49_13309, partial [Trebouxia sp. A1-2]
MEAHRVGQQLHQPRAEAVFGHWTIGSTLLAPLKAIKDVQQSRAGRSRACKETSKLNRNPKPAWREDNGPRVQGAACGTCQALSIGGREAVGAHDASTHVMKQKRDRAASTACKAHQVKRSRHSRSLPSSNGGQ